MLQVGYCSIHNIHRYTCGLLVDSRFIQRHYEMTKNTIKNHQARQYMKVITTWILVPLALKPYCLSLQDPRPRYDCPALTLHIVIIFYSLLYSKYVPWSYYKTSVIKTKKRPQPDYTKITITTHHIDTPCKNTGKPNKYILLQVLAVQLHIHLFGSVLTSFYPAVLQLRLIGDSKCYL